MKAISTIDVVGAATNNLRDVDVSLAANAITAIVGVSGSGKSSLVDKTIAAIAHERTHSFLELPGGPAAHDVRAFVGATPPVVAVAQRAYQTSSRTTVATSTAFMRVLRRLFLRHSWPFFTEANKYVAESSPEAFAAWLTKYADGKVIVWAVPVYQLQTDGLAAVRALAESGIANAVIYSETDRGRKAETGTDVPTSRFKGLKPDVRHTIEAKVGELTLSTKHRAKLLALLETAWVAGKGNVFVEIPASSDPALIRAFARGLDSRRHCVHPGSVKAYRIPDAHLLSFNAPNHEDGGACPCCKGLGRVVDVSENLLVTQPEKSMHGGAFGLWTEKNYRYVNIQHATIEGLRGREGFDPDLPWKSLSASARRLVLDGSEELVVDIDPRTKKKASSPHSFKGFRAAILDRVDRSSSSAEALKRFTATGDCPSCGGTRWRFESRALRVGNRSIDDILATPFSALASEAEQWCQDSMREARSEIAIREVSALIESIAHIARSFEKVGIGHLSGNRSLQDVSDGEARRIRLAGVLNSRLSGLLVVLDEPGRGLHDADLVKLAEVIEEAARSHTVVMSEHRPRLVASASQVVQLGPGAGSDGGLVVKPGSPKRASVEPRRSHFSVNAETRFLEIEGVTANTVRDQSIRIPLGTLTCIAGVSGSGKSSFVRGALVPALCDALPKTAVDIEDFHTVAGSWRKCKGVNYVKAVYALDQATPLGHTRSLVATYLDLAEPLRQSFAKSQEAKDLGLSASDFGTNAGHGRCRACLGLGTAPDGGTCPLCGGLRFGHEALSVRVGGLNMAEWLDLPLSALAGTGLTKNAPELVPSLVELGIGHLSLGRSLSTLSGGEIQRLRLTRAIAVDGVSDAVFVLDEPACGLHPRDVENLRRALRHVIDNGKNTVIAVEHDVLLLSECDYLVEFGPGGGPDGGFVIAQGTPEEIRASSTPTGWALGQPSRSVRARNREKQAAARLPNDLNEALAVRQEFRQIIGDDVSPPDEGTHSQPGAIFSDSDFCRRPLELGGLDRALISIALEDVPKPVIMLEEMLRLWEGHPSAKLYVNPLLEAMSIWGDAIPSSVIEQAQRDAKAMGLDDFSDSESDPWASRVTGDRLQPTGDTALAKQAALRDAWALGSGYVELLDSSGRLLAFATGRLFESMSQLVGRRSLRVEHFTRRASQGSCPMCKGAGVVQDVNERRIIGNPRATVLDENFLASGVAASLKGFRRSELVPFFRRMIEEGIWRDVAWNKMTPDEKATVLWGCWARPGAGTFLKRGNQFDGSEVNHWLAWSGLAGQIETLNDGKDGSHNGGICDCPACEGTGLSKNAKLLHIAGRSLQDWTQNATVKDLVLALERKTASNRRQSMELQRLLYCLEPLARSTQGLVDAVEEASRSEVLSRTAIAFTGMPTFFR